MYLLNNQCLIYLRTKQNVYVCNQKLVKTFKTIYIIKPRQLIVKQFKFKNSLKLDKYSSCSKKLRHALNKTKMGCILKNN